MSLVRNRAIISSWEASFSWVRKILICSRNTTSISSKIATCGKFDLHGIELGEIEIIYRTVVDRPEIEPDTDCRVSHPRAHVYFYAEQRIREIENCRRASTLRCIRQFVNLKRRVREEFARGIPELGKTSCPHQAQYKENDCGDKPRSSIYLHYGPYGYDQRQ